MYTPSPACTSPLVPSSTNGCVTTGASGAALPLAVSCGLCDTELMIFSGSGAPLSSVAETVNNTVSAPVANTRCCIVCTRRLGTTPVPGRRSG